MPLAALGQAEKEPKPPTPDQWLLLVLGLVASVALLEIVREVARYFIVRYQKVVDRQGVGTRGMCGATALVVVSFCWRWFNAVIKLPYPDRVARGVDLALIAGGAWLAVAFWDAASERVAERAGDLSDRAERLLLPLLSKLVHGVIWTVASLVALSVFSVDWRSMIAGLGIGGLLVALAAKDSVENLFGSVTILFDMPFQLGDLVKVSGVEGVVEEINLRSTRIRTADDAMVTLPNSNLIKAVVENQGARRFRRQKLILHAGLHNSAEQLQELVRRTRAFLDAQEWVEKEKTIVELNDFFESSMGVLILCYIRTQSYGDEIARRGEIIGHVMAVAEELDLRFLAEPGAAPKNKAI